MNVPVDYDERVNMMKEMLRLVASDGELADMEKHLCWLAAGKMDFSSQEFENILQSVINESN